ncbi:MAG: DMT family transporter [Paracoccaceae bacterium]
MSQNNPRLGILLMVATTFVFAVQDGLSRYLAGEYNTIMIIMLRYWFFAAFVVTLFAMRKGGICRVARTELPMLQILRGVLLVAEICVTVFAFVKLGLVESHAIFACYPLLIAALSGPMLGERVGWRRWVAIGIGFIGVLVILRPGIMVFSPIALIPLAASLMFAVYGLLTRYVARKDSAETSFFWTGIAGAVAITLIGPFFWQPIARADWWIMGILCVTGVGGHYLLIKAYAIAEASTVQPFAYFQLVFAAIIGLTIFHENLDPWIALGAGIVVSSGLFTLWRARRTA